jgi:hypothetical protein
MDGMACIANETGSIVPPRNPKTDLGAAIAAKIHIISVQLPLIEPRHNQGAVSYQRSA